MLLCLNIEPGNSDRIMCAHSLPANFRSMIRVLSCTSNPSTASNVSRVNLTWKTTVLSRPAELYETGILCSLTHPLYFKILEMFQPQRLLTSSTFLLIQFRFPVEDNTCRPDLELSLVILSFRLAEKQLREATVSKRYFLGSVALGRLSCRGVINRRKISTLI